MGPWDDATLYAGLHVGFRAPDRAAVDAFWQAGIEAAATAPRRAVCTVHGPTTTAGFLSHPDGNSVKAVDERPRATRARRVRIDHCGSASATRRRRAASTRRSPRTPGSASRTTRRTPTCSSLFSTSPSRSARHRSVSAHRARPPRLPRRTRRRHCAGLPSAAALAAGYDYHGTPGERAVYHPGPRLCLLASSSDGHNAQGRQPQPLSLSTVSTLRRSATASRCDAATPAGRTVDDAGSCST